MNRAFEKELSRALATELDTAAPKSAAAPLSGGTYRKTTEWLARFAALPVQIAGLEGLGAGSNGGTGVVQCGPGTCPVGEGMDITQCAVWSEHTRHADSHARSANFYTGQVNIRCLNWNKPHMQESVVRW